MKQLLLIFVGLLYCGLNPASAQVCLRKGTNKGIYVDRTVSRTEILMQFGQPERTLAHEDEAANGFMQTYEYAQLSISVVDGILFDFGFDSSGYEVIVYDKYSLKVGDDYAAFLDSIPRSEVRERKYEEQAQLFFIIEGTDCFYDSSLIVAFDKRGKVTSISWFSPV